MISDLLSTASLFIFTKKILFIMLSIFSIGLIIAFHEFGHFILGKLFKVNIPSFSIGFGPKIFSRMIGTTEFSLSLIPMGGYVEAETGTYHNPTPGTLAYLSYWKKLAIVSGGIICNILLSYFLLSFLYFQGLPSNPFVASSKHFFIESIEKDSAAAKAGLQSKDTILAIDNQQLNNQLPTLLDYIQKHPNITVMLTVNRNGHIFSVPAILGSRKEGKQEVGILGVQFNFEKSEPLPFLKSLHAGFVLTISILKNSFKAFTKTIKNKDTNRLVSPLMVIKVGAQSAAQGLDFFLFLLAYISIGLAVLNVIPLPILDGGQALTYTIEAIIRRPIPEKALYFMHLGCWVLMLGLYVLLTYQDILKLFFN